MQRRGTAGAALIGSIGVLETYRCRWQIEESFKALKSGCAFERRQLEGLDALQRALAIFPAIT